MSFARTISSFSELSVPTVPKKTATYYPIRHDALVTQLLEASRHALPAHSLDDQLFALSNNGKEMLTYLVFKHVGDSLAPPMLITAVNSYNKRLRVTFGCGVRHSVPSILVEQMTKAGKFTTDKLHSVCTQGVLSSKLKYARKHTKNVEADLEIAIDAIFDGVKRGYGDLVQFTKALQYTKVDMDTAHALVGLLQGRKILGVRASTKMYDSLRKLDETTLPLIEFYQGAVLQISTDRVRNVLTSMADLYTVVESLLVSRSLFNNALEGI